jgi:hypothetical protein
MTTSLAQTLLLEFADSTGLAGGETPRRYLWTDAYAVDGFLELFLQTGKDRYLDLARKLVDQVHHSLGRHRKDDPRQGWISGLSEQEGERHPTSGGLRIGKKINERGVDEPPDSQREWDQDGQYFHYLTKWMHALRRMSRQTRQPLYFRWAVELAAVAHRAFCCQVTPGGPRRMVWKMSIDLSRPLVVSMGHHDPLDGLITCLELQSDADSEQCAGPDLTPAIEEFSELCQAAGWATGDPLGVGGLLDNVARLARLVFEGGLQRQELLRRLLEEAELSLRMFSRTFPQARLAEARLAFRELGLAIGLLEVDGVRHDVEVDDHVSAMMDRLLVFRPLAENIRDYWSDATHRRNRTWADHNDINSVMLACTLLIETP